MAAGFSANDLDDFDPDDWVPGRLALDISGLHCGRVLICQHLLWWIPNFHISICKLPCLTLRQIQWQQTYGHPMATQLLGRHALMCLKLARLSIVGELTQRTAAKRQNSTPQLLTMHCSQDDLPPTLPGGCYFVSHCPWACSSHKSLGLLVREDTAD